LYVTAPEAVIVALLPIQMVGLLGEKFRGGLTVTVTDDEFEHPLISTPIREYVVVEVGLTVTGLGLTTKLGPFIHEYVPPTPAPLPVKTVDDPPQIKEGEAVPLMVGLLFTSTFDITVSEHPEAPIPITVIVVDVVGVMVTVFVEEIILFPLSYHT
jgi:hypothetical protein